MSKEVHVTAAPGVSTFTLIEDNPFKYSGYQHTLNSVESVLELLVWKGSQPNSVIICDENKPAIRIILDDTVEDRPQDQAFYRFPLHDTIKEWLEVLERGMSQKDFVSFLKNRTPEEFPDAEMLLAMIQQFKFATEIIGDFVYDDNNNITCMFKTKTGEDTTKVPSQFEIYSPMFQGSDYVYEMEIELEIGLPRDEKTKPFFILTCPKYNRYKKDATNREFEKLRKALPDHLILLGTA